MVIRLLTVALMASGVTFATQSYAQTTLNSGKSATVPGGTSAAGVTTTVKSSKSNTSDRMGGAGGGKASVKLNPQPEPPSRR